MDRRDFLGPRQLATSAGQLAGALEEVQTAAVEALTPSPPPPPEYSLLRFWRNAMATTFELLLPFGTPNAYVGAEDVFNEIDRLESQLTVYRDTSEVSRLNRAAYHAPIPVEEGLFDLLMLAARISEISEGAFDVSSGALIKAWGFFRGPRRVPEEAERQAALARTGMRHVLLDSVARTVRFLRPGLEINLGSIGKGYALDRAVTRLRCSGIFPSALLHGGHSSVYAVGAEPGNERGWAVGLCHPWDQERRMAIVTLRDQALGTSSASFRHLEYKGQKLGHLLDPRSGWPGTGMDQASALAPTAAEADALATAFYVMGIEESRKLCASHPDWGAVLLPRGERTPLLLGLARERVQIV